MCYDDIETSNSYLKNCIITISLSDKFRIWRITIQCSRESGKPVHIRGIRCSRRGPGARLCCICCCLSQQQRYLSIVQINPFSPSPSHSTTASQSFRYIAKIFSRFGLAGGRGRGNFFHRSPDPLSVAMQPHCFILCQTKIK